MWALVAVINNPKNVVSILDEFLEIGVKGATVVESAGMAHLVADHVPFFSRFAELGEDDSKHNKTLFVIFKDRQLLDRAIKAIEDVVGDLNEPDTGLVFTVPVDFCKGVDNQE